MNIYLNDLGIVNALGSGKEQVVERLLAGTSPGMVNSEQWLLGDGEAGNAILGAVQDELPEVPEQLSDYRSRTSQLLLAALDQIKSSIDACINKVGHQRVGVVIGTSTSGIEEGEKYIAGKIAAEDYCYRSQEIGAPALLVAEYLQVSGPCLTVSTACSSSAKVFATARNWLELDLCDVVIAGGADSLCQLTVNGFHALGLVSESLCQPFQSGRSGINIGEAAALFVVSKTPAAVRLAGVGESSDAHHISAPHPEGEGAARAMDGAMDEAGLKAADLTVINAHGTATPANDIAEALAISRSGADTVPCVSTKPLTGHTLGAAGATELGFCWLLMQQDVLRLPAQANFSVRDPALAPVHILEQALQPDEGEEISALSNSFAFGGSNVSVALKRIDAEACGRKRSRP